MTTFAEFRVLVCFLSNVVWFSDIYFASTSIINYKVTSLLNALLVLWYNIHGKHWPILLINKFHLFVIHQVVCYLYIWCDIHSKLGCFFDNQQIRFTNQIDRRSGLSG